MKIKFNKTRPGTKLLLRKIKNKNLNLKKRQNKRQKQTKFFKKQFSFSQQTKTAITIVHTLGWRAARAAHYNIALLFTGV